MRPNLLAPSALILAAMSQFVSAQAPAVGDYRYNDQLSDYSLAAPATRHQRDLSDLARIKAIDPSGFPEQDLISHDLFLRQLQERVEDYDLKEFEMPLSASGGGGGIHANLADLPLSMPFDSVKHYEDYISSCSRHPTLLGWSRTEIVVFRARGGVPCLLGQLRQLGG